MPGYEVYNLDGTLVLRVRRMKGGEMVEIPDKELRDLALAAAPLREDGSKAAKKDFSVTALEKESYCERRDKQESQGVPREDGSFEPHAEWLKRVENCKPTEAVEK